MVNEIGYPYFGRGKRTTNLSVNLVTQCYEHGLMVLTSSLPFAQSAGAFADDQVLTAT